MEGTLHPPINQYNSSGSRHLTAQAYIDFEIEEAERERARHLYERLLERTSHVKVYISYALMEASTLGGGEDEDGNEVQGGAGDDEMARSIFERGYKDLRGRGEKEDVSWRSLNRGVELTFSVHYCSKHGRRSKSNTVRTQTEQRYRR